MVDVGRGVIGRDLKADLLVAFRHHRKGEACRENSVGSEMANHGLGSGRVPCHDWHHGMDALDGLEAEIGRALCESAG